MLSGACMIMSAQAALLIDYDAQLSSSVLTNASGKVTNWQNQGTGGSDYDAIPGPGTVLYPSSSLSASGKNGVDFGTVRNGLVAASSAEQDAFLDFAGGASGNSGFSVLVAFKADTVDASSRNTVFLNHGNAGNANGFGLRFNSAGSMELFLNGTVYTNGGANAVVAAGDTMVYGMTYTAATGAFEFWDSKNDSSITGTTTINGNFSTSQDRNFIGTKKTNSSTKKW